MLKRKIFKVNNNASQTSPTDTVLVSQLLFWNRYHFLKKNDLGEEFCQNKN